MGLFDQTYDQQLATIRSRQIYDARVSYASQSASPALAQGVVAQSQTYPWMAPQTAYALAANGNQPGDQLSFTVATASLNKKKGGFLHRLGEMTSAPFRAAATGIGHALGEIGTLAQPVVRTAFTAAETPFQVGSGVLRDVAAVGGNIIGGAVSGAATGAAVGLAGFNPISVVGGAVGGAVIGGGAGALAELRGHHVEGTFVNPLAQSTGGQALGALFSGNRVDLGSGFLPGGKIHEDQIKNAQRAATIDGHALTPGRMLASGLVRPGSTAYNVISGLTDAVTTWELDPVNKLIGPEYKAQREGAKVIPGVATEAGPVTNLLRRSGVLATADPGVALDKAKAFLETDGAARRFITRVTGETSASAIRAASKGKLPVEIANQLAAADNEQDVLRILMGGVEGATLKERAAVTEGRGLASTFTATRPGARLSAAMARLNGTLPDHTVDLMDIDRPGGGAKLGNAVDQLDRWLTQARFPKAERQPILDELMRSTTAEEARGVFDRTMNGDVVKRLKALGHDDETISGYLRQYKTEEKALRDQVVHEVSNNTVPKAVVIDGEPIPLNKPNEVLEHLDYAVHLPSVSGAGTKSRVGIRQLTTPGNTPFGKSLRALYNSDAWKSTTHAADFFMSKWKISAVVRPAFVLRTLAMDHAKMVAHGLETRLSDPASLFRMALNPELRPSALEGAVEGDLLSRAEDYMKAMTSQSVHLSPDDVAPYQQILRPGEDGFPEAWSARIAEQHADPLARAVAGNGLEAAQQAFWDGPLAAERDRLIGALNRPDLATREGADAYLADVVGSKLSALTADNPHLLDAIATGELRTAGEFGEVGESIPLLAEGPHGFVNPDAAPHLEGMALDPDIEVPMEIPGAMPMERVDPDYGRKVSRMTNWFFTNLVNKPSDFLVRSPEFNQSYWSEIADHAGMLSDEGAEALRTQLASGKVEITDKTRKRIEAALAGGKRGDLVLEHLDELAKARSLDAVRSMTVDMASHRGWQDAMRILMPFTKDWQQDLTQWARIAADNPNAFRKAQMTVQGAIGSGFFHEDENGRYVFNYPGSGLVSRVVTGVPGGMTGRAAGLSMFTTDVMPGFGPFVSIAASKLLPNRPEFDDLRNFMSPYGDPTAQGTVEAFLPPWAKTAKDALADPENDRDTANVTMQIARYLVSTGDYSADTPEEQARLLKEAGSRARKQMILLALGKAVLPSSPKLEAVAKVGPGDGRTVVARLLYDDLRKMRDEDYDTSSQRFLEKYGDNALLFLQGATRPIVPGAAETQEQSDFARSHPGIKEKLPNTYAFFADQGKETDDLGAITRQLHTGERQALTPKQQVQLANDRVGSMIYYRVKDSLGPRINKGQEQVLSQLKAALMVKYPGFGTSIPGLAARATDEQGVTTTVIPELEKGLADPKIAATNTGQALGQYLQLRTAVIAAAQARGLQTYATSAKTADLRAVMRKAAAMLGQNSRGFALLFDRVLDSEMRADTQPGAILSA